ncbi:MAG: hypothetical protein C6Y22_13250 [Hapalosiphonaceae cyanobacterium JJU2]|nr:MAG: hypothetical protein C6Y22_13250 [Hapalosiphonaceae cyanobacterium JJU2]
MSLPGKVAIVTGASPLIGRAIALKLAEQEASITVNYAGNAEKAQEVVAERATNQEVRRRRQICGVGTYLQFGLCVIMKRI